MYFSTYCIVSDRKYPNGGGEAYMYDTITQLAGVVGKTVWIFFHNDEWSRDQIAVSENQGYLEVFINGFSRKKLETWLLFLQPSIVHHQGGYRSEVVDVCYTLKLPVLTGLHFWNDCVDLHPDYGNASILENKHVHEPNPRFEQVHQRAVVYVPSPFVQQCVSEICDTQLEHVILPISKQSLSVSPATPGAERPYDVALLNVHHLKGGVLLAQLVRLLSCDVQILGFSTEKMSACDAELKRLERTHANLTIKGHVTDISTYLQRTKVLIVPSVVDETFCRALFEGMYYGCACVCSNFGNLPHLAGGAAVVMPTMDAVAWTEEISGILEDVERFQRLQGLARAHARARSHTRAI